MLRICKKNFLNAREISMIDDIILWINNVFRKGAMERKKTRKKRRIIVSHYN